MKKSNHAASPLPSDDSAVLKHPAPQPQEDHSFSVEDIANGQSLVPGLGRRMLAYMIDFALTVIIGISVLMFVLWATTGTAVAAFLANLYGVAFFCFATNAAHHIWMESHPRWGATVGKRIMGLTVMDGDGQSISRSVAIQRMLWRIPSVLTLGLLYLMAGRGNYGMALHDIKTATFTAVRGFPHHRVESGLRAGREMTKADKACLVLSGLFLLNVAYNLIKAVLVAPDWP